MRWDPIVVGRWDPEPHPHTLVEFSMDPRHLQFQEILVFIFIFIFIRRFSFIQASALVGPFFEDCLI